MNIMNIGDIEIDFLQTYSDLSNWEISIDDMNGELAMEETDNASDRVTAISVKEIIPIIEQLKQQLEEANTVIKIYSNPNDMYYVDKVVKVAGKEVFYIKDIQQIAMLGKEYLNKFGE